MKRIILMVLLLLFPVTASSQMGLEDAIIALQVMAGLRPELAQAGELLNVEALVTESEFQELFTVPIGKRYLITQIFTGTGGDDRGILLMLQVNGKEIRFHFIDHHSYTGLLQLWFTEGQTVAIKKDNLRSLNAPQTYIRLVGEVY